LERNQERKPQHPQIEQILALYGNVFVNLRASIIIPKKVGATEAVR